MGEAEIARIRKEKVEKMKQEARRKRSAHPRFDLMEQINIMNDFERRYFANKK